VIHAYDNGFLDTVKREQAKYGGFWYRRPPDLLQFIYGGPYAGVYRMSEKGWLQWNSAWIPLFPALQWNRMGLSLQLYNKEGVQLMEKLAPFIEAMKDGPPDVQEAYKLYDWFRRAVERGHARMVRDQKGKRFPKRTKSWERRLAQVNEEWDKKEQEVLSPQELADDRRRRPRRRRTLTALPSLWRNSPSFRRWKRCTKKSRIASPTS
jgi:hypothetical protein